jgi:two-component system C4-dicarboxylate transport sensor histidine kinase DctB
MKENRLADGSAIVQIDSEPLERRALGSSVDYLVHGDRVLGTNWRLLVMSELTPARIAARNSAALAVLTFVLLATLALYFHQRRRIIRQTLAARLALERANDQLERKVAERTLALSDANRQLQGEIGERQRAEEELRATLVDLVHTGSGVWRNVGSVTHGSATADRMRTLSNNAIVLLGEAAPARSVRTCR